jgi:hypothetical protein
LTIALLIIVCPRFVNLGLGLFPTTELTTASSRLMSKELLIGGIHLRKIGHISNENPRKSINISTVHFPKIHGKVLGSKERPSINCWLWGPLSKLQSFSVSGGKNQGFTVFLLHILYLSRGRKIALKCISGRTKGYVPVLTLLYSGVYSPTVYTYFARIVVHNNICTPLYGVEICATTDTQG